MAENFNEFNWVDRRRHEPMRIVSGSWTKKKVAARPKPALLQRFASTARSLASARLRNSPPTRSSLNEAQTCSPSAMRGAPLLGQCGDPRLRDCASQAPASPKEIERKSMFTVLQ